MFPYLDLVGLPYIEGKQDCYSIVRTFIRRNWDIEMFNLARPTRFWEAPHLDLYSNFHLAGFKPVFDVPFQIGDWLLMPVATAVNSHSAVVVGDNLILHHLHGRLSAVEPLRPKWSPRVTVHLRHPRITASLKAALPPPVHFHEVVDAPVLRDPEIQGVLAGLVDAREGAVRPDHA